MADGLEKLKREADEAWQKAYGKSEPENPPEEHEEPEETPEPEQAAPEEPQEPELEPTPVPPPQDEWKQKYETLQGKYNAEVPRMAEQIRYLQGQVDALNKPTPPQPQSGATAEERKMLDLLGLSDEHLPDLRNFIDQRAMSVVQPQIQKVAQSSQQSAAQMFWSSVNRQIPNYAQIADDPLINQWIEQKVPLTRNTYLDLAKEAAADLDAERYVAIIQQAIQAVHPPESKPAPEKVTPAATARVTPKRAGASSPKTSEPQPMSREEYSKRSDYLAKLTATGKREEAARLQAELDAVVSERRLSPD